MFLAVLLMIFSLLTYGLMDCSLEIWINVLSVVIFRLLTFTQIITLFSFFAFIWLSPRRNYVYHFSIHTVKLYSARSHNFVCFICWLLVPSIQTLLLVINSTFEHRTPNIFDWIKNIPQTFVRIYCDVVILHAAYHSNVFVGWNENGN